MTTLRLIFVFIIGYAVMFFLQRNLFLDGTIEIPVYTREELIYWLLKYYNTSAQIVFFLSCLATLIWYGVTSYFNDRDRKPGIQLFRVLWAALTLLPLVSILWALSRIPEEVWEYVVTYLASFYVLDVILLFWFATAISTPEALKYAVIPGSFCLRHLPFFK